MIAQTSFPACLVPSLPAPAAAQSSASCYTGTLCPHRGSWSWTSSWQSCNIHYSSITFPFCTAFLSEKWCVGVDCRSNCSRFFTLDRYENIDFRLSEIQRVCPWKWDMKCASYGSSWRCLCAAPHSLCALGVQLLSASPSVNLLFCFVWRYL